MATFLELVNKVERESGTVAQAQRLSTVSGARGRQEKVVAWTSRAWEMIQRERPDWTFLRKSFAHSLTVGRGTYTAAQLGITDFGSWLPDADHFNVFTTIDPDLGKGSEMRLGHIPYRNWLDMYDIGTHDPQRPMWVATGFDRSINVGPFPDKAYTLRGRYRRSVQTLAADGDVPYIDPDFHDAIVYRALVLLNEHEEGQFQIAVTAANYAAVRAGLLRAYTEAIET